MHDLGVNAATGTGLVCNCGASCADLAAWHGHTVRTHNNPDAQAIELRGDRVHDIIVVAPDMGGIIRPCTKIGCGRRGNDRECWTMTIPGHPTLYELPSREIARGIAMRGGVLSRTYELSTC